MKALVINFIIFLIILCVIALTSKKDYDKICKEQNGTLVELYRPTSFFCASNDDGHLFRPRNLIYDNQR